MLNIPIYLINMDRDQDRLDYMTKALGAAGLTFTRLPAVNGRQLPIAWAARFIDNRASPSPLKPGEIGCFASHLAAMTLLLETNATASLVLEDDLLVPENFTAEVEALLAALPATWDIVRLSNNPKRAYIPIAALIDGHELVRYSTVPNNTGAYLISRRGAAKFLATAKGDLAIDEEMRRPWTCGLDTYGVVPQPILSNIFDSTIDSLGDRGLGQRKWKLRSNKPTGPREWARATAYQIKTLGLLNWCRCLARNLLNKVTPRLPRNAHSDDIVRRFRIAQGSRVR